jgi:hypothetical protein
MLAQTRVSLAEILLASGDRTAARDLLVAADRWYTRSGAGDGAALAACLLATLRAEDGDPNAEQALRAIHTAAQDAGDDRMQGLALDALAAVRAYDPDGTGHVHPTADARHVEADRVVPE